MDSQQPYDPPPQQPYTPPEQAYAPPQPPPPQGAYYAQQPPPMAAAGGLSDAAAGAIAYITIIPAIVFLILEPYSRRPFVKFNALQCLGLAVVGIAMQLLHVIPILGTLVALFGGLVLFVVWIICIVNAAQGKIFRVPVIGEFAAKQAGL